MVVPAVRPKQEIPCVPVEMDTKEHAVGQRVSVTFNSFNKIFENHLNHIILVFIGKLSSSTLR